MSNTPTPKEVVTSVDNEKKKAIEIAVSQIEKQFGKGLTSQFSSVVPGIAAQNASQLASELSKAAVYSNKLNPYLLH